MGASASTGTNAIIIEGGTLALGLGSLGATNDGWGIRRNATNTTFEFRGGTISGNGTRTVAILNKGGTGTFDIKLSGTATQTFDTTKQSIAIDANTRLVDLTSGGSVQIVGSNTTALILQGTNTYTGDTVISSGILRVQNVGATVFNGTISGNAITGLQSTAGLFVGQRVSGSGITDGAVIASIDSSSQVTITGQTTTGATSGTFAAANGTLEGTTLNYNSQGGVLSFGQSTALKLGGLKGNQNLALTNDAAAAVALTLGGNNQSTSYAGVLSGGGSLEKLGAGTLTLSGSSTFSGATAVNAGKLVVNGALANTSGMTVADGAALGGSGSINGLTTVDGTLTPGNSPGILTFDSLLLGSSASTIIEIESAGVRGTAYDGITVLDADGLTYGGSLTFAFGSSALADNTLFDIFDFVGTPSGNFTTLTSTGFYDGTWSSIGGGQWQSSKGSQTLTFSQAEGTLVIVPEPDTVIFAGIGIAMAGWSLWKRRRIARILQK